MIKRRLIRWSLILVVLAAFVVWQEPTRVVWGWVRGEAFYDGRPTSWWAEELNRWTVSESFVEREGGGCDLVSTYSRSEWPARTFLQTMLRLSGRRSCSLPAHGRSRRA
jgi:hypothetical protein